MRWFQTLTGIPLAGGIALAGKEVLNELRSIGYKTLHQHTIRDVHPDISEKQRGYVDAAVQGFKH